MPLSLEEHLTLLWRSHLITPNKDGTGFIVRGSSDPLSPTHASHLSTLEVNLDKIFYNDGFGKLAETSRYGRYGDKEYALEIKPVAGQPFDLNSLQQWIQLPPGETPQQMLERHLAAGDIRIDANGIATIDYLLPKEQEQLRSAFDAAGHAIPEAGGTVPESMLKLPAEALKTWIPQAFATHVSAPETSDVTTQTHTTATTEAALPETPGVTGEPGTLHLRHIVFGKGRDFGLAGDEYSSKLHGGGLSTHDASALGQAVSSVTMRLEAPNRTVELLYKLDKPGLNGEAEYVFCKYLQGTTSGRSGPLTGNFHAVLLSESELAQMHYDLGALSKQLITQFNGDGITLADGSVLPYESWGKRHGSTEYDLAVSVNDMHAKPVTPVKPSADALNQLKNTKSSEVYALLKKLPEEQRAYLYEQGMAVLPEAHFHEVQKAMQSRGLESKINSEFLFAASAQQNAGINHGIYDGGISETNNRSDYKYGGAEPNAGGTAGLYGAVENRNPLTTGDEHADRHERQNRFNDQESELSGRGRRVPGGLSGARGVQAANGSGGQAAAESSVKNQPDGAAVGTANQNSEATKPRSLLGQNSAAFKPGLGVDRRINLDEVYGLPEFAPVDPAQVKEKILHETTALTSDLEPMLRQAHQQAKELILETLKQKIAQRQAIVGTHTGFDKELFGLEYAERKTQKMSNTEPLTFSAVKDLIRGSVSRDGAFYQNDFATRDQAENTILRSNADMGLWYEAQKIKESSNLTEAELAVFQKRMSEIVQPVKTRLQAYEASVKAELGNISPASVYQLNPRINQQEHYLQSLGQSVEGHAKAFNEHIPGKGIVKDLKVSHETFADVEPLESQQNKLYLRTLTTMLRERGYDIPAEKLFTHEALIFGSQPVVHLEDFSGPGAGEELLTRGSFKNESTTPYKFEFNFLQLPVAAPAVDGVIVEKAVAVPTMAFDAKAIGLLKDNGVSHDAIKTHFNNHLRMSEFAEHDGTIHQLTLPFLGDAKTSFVPLDPYHLQIPAGIDEESLKQAMEEIEAFKSEIEPVLKGRELGKAHSNTYVEDHALATQAQILKRMFAEVPKRKEFVLKYAAETYEHLAQVQQTALAECKTNTQRYKVNEAVTYLAETYYHRFARVISPEDPDLHKKIQLKLPDGTLKETSVAEAADRINSGENEARIITPKALRQTLPKEGLSALKILEHHSDAVLSPGIYRTIHKLDRFPMMTPGERATTEQEMAVYKARHEEAQSKITNEAYQTAFDPEHYKTKPYIQELKFTNAVDALATLRDVPRTLPITAGPSVPEVTERTSHGTENRPVAAPDNKDAAANQSASAQPPVAPTAASLTGLSQVAAAMGGLSKAPLAYTVTPEMVQNSKLVFPDRAVVPPTDGTVPLPPAGHPEQPHAVAHGSPRVNHAGMAMSISGFAGTMKQYQENGFNPIYGVSAGSMAFNVAQDVTGGTLLGAGKVSKVFHEFKLPLAIGAIPDAVNLIEAKTDDQRNASITGLGINGGLGLAAATPGTALASLGGPEAVAVFLAANYVGQRTVTPVLKIADGYLHNDQAKMDIGKARLNAGVSELAYKSYTLPGVISLAGNIVDGVGEVSTSVGDLTSMGTHWLDNKVMGKEYADMHQQLSDANIVMPGSMDPVVALRQLGTGLNWAGDKVDEFGTWVSDKTGWGADQRKSIAVQNKKADALQAKYDEAHKHHIEPPVEVVQVNHKIEAYNGATQKLIGLLQSKQPVKETVLNQAYKDYQSQHQQLVNDPVYQSGTAAANDRIRKAYMYEHPIANDSNPRIKPTSVADATLVYAEADKKQHEIELFLKNPVTPDFKANVAAFDQQLGGFVKAKHQERVGQGAIQTYTGAAKGYAVTSKALISCLEEIALGEGQIQYFQKWLAEAGKDGAVVTTEAITQARSELSTLEKAREAQEAALAKIENAADALLKKHHDAQNNVIYKDNKEAQNLGHVLEGMKKSIDQTQQLLVSNAVAQLNQGLSVLEQKAQTMAEVPTITSVTTPATSTQNNNTSATSSPQNYEATLQALITQNAAFADKDLQNKLLAEAGKLTAYYMQGVDKNGATVSDASASLKDGVVDDQELQTMVAQLNAKFKSAGVNLATSDVATISLPVASKTSREQNSGRNNG